MVITLAVSALVALPLAQKFAQQRLQDAVKAAPAGRGGPQFFTAAVYPQLFTVLGCIALAAIVGVVVAKSLPTDNGPSKPSSQRSRRNVK
jgi:uncharacterized membrane protein